MGKSIRIECGSVQLAAELNDTDTAREVAAALPVESRASRWGEEVYFELPVVRDLEPGARAEVEVGEIGYWPAGHAFCVFFGRTPASTTDQPRAASAVTIIGRTTQDATQLRAVKDGEKITVRSEE